MFGPDQIQLRVSRTLWAAAVEDSGESACSFAPSRALRLVEAEASHQIMLGNCVTDGVLTLHISMGFNLGKADNLIGYRALTDRHSAIKNSGKGSTLVGSSCDKEVIPATVTSGGFGREQLLWVTPRRR